MPEIPPTSTRAADVAGALAPLLAQLRFYDSQRRLPGISDLLLGNPQEMPLAGFVSAVQRHAQPRDKDWFAYKQSEPAAKAVVAQRLRDWRGLPFEPDDIAMTTGAFGALAAAFRAVLDPGDEVIYSLPPWFLYEPMLLSAGAVPVKVRVRPTDHDLDLDAISSAIGPRTRAVIVNTPNNPTGRIYPPRTLIALAELLTGASSTYGKPIWLISDEPYSRLVFSDAEFHSPSEYYPYTLISYSYGKVLLTPGERIGWLAVSPSVPNRQSVRDAIEVSQVAAGWLYPNATLQRAITELEALSIDLPAIQRKRDQVVEALRGFGYELRSPEGTFYLWVKAPDSDDQAFCRSLAVRGVLVLPGSICEVPGYFRISLTGTQAMIDSALPAFQAVAGEYARR